MNRFRGLLAVASVIISAGGAKAETLDALSLEQAVALASAWLDANVSVAAAQDSPSVSLASPKHLSEMRYGPDFAGPPGEVVAVYRDVEQTIFLEETWNGGSPAAWSVLVHELVHHRQNVAGLRFACPGEREVAAYEAQDTWLRQFGGSLEADFEIDAATLMLRSTCAF